MNVNGIVPPDGDRMPTPAQGFWPLNPRSDVWVRPLPAVEHASTYIAFYGGDLLRAADDPALLGTITLEQNPQSQAVPGWGFTQGG